MKTRMSSQGRIALPAAICELDGIAPGDEFSIERVGKGEYSLKRIRRANDGLVDWLLACPVKDFFVPLTSELTSAI